MSGSKEISCDNYFRQIDRFGKPLRFRYNKHTELKTRTGAIITLIIGIVALIYIVYTAVFLIKQTQLSHEDYLQRNIVEEDTPVHYNETKFDFGAIQILVPEVEWPFTDDTIVKGTPWSKFKS